MNETPIIERAFQLAPECVSVRDLKAAMKSEGYAETSLDAYLSGRGIRDQLKARFKTRGASSFPTT